jgi:hypothetical protein
MMTWLVFIGSNPLDHGRRRSHRSLRQPSCAPVPQTHASGNGRRSAKRLKRPSTAC